MNSQNDLIAKFKPDLKLWIFLMHITNNNELRGPAFPMGILSPGFLPAPKTVCDPKRLFTLPGRIRVF